MQQHNGGDQSRTMVETEAVGVQPVSLSYSVEQLLRLVFARLGPEEWGGTLQATNSQHRDMHE